MSKRPVVAIIPARYASTRLPGKPLIQLHGKTMIQRVYERASLLQSVDRVLVATDDQRIFDAVKNFGGEVVMTPDNIATGSERVGFVARDLAVSIVVNLQGDEPLVDTGALDALITLMKTDENISVGTLGCAITDEAEWREPSVVKVITDEEMNAIYFSRAAIPYHRDEKFQALPNLFRHIGVYVFRKSFLMAYLSWPPSTLENIEKLEQLRILEKGHSIKLMKATNFSPGVDTPADIKVVETLIKKRGE